ncbi:MAG: VWA domain-containing protein [Acidobacteriota bacterium]
MRFSNVSFFYFLYFIPFVALFLFWKILHTRRTLKLFGEEPLIGRLTASSSMKKRVAKSVLLILTMIFFILTGAGPQWGMRMESITRKGVDIIFALDVSRSMLAEDVKPNRLEMAKREIDDILKRLSEDRISLIAFSGEAFVQCPATLDYSTFKLLLDAVDPEISPTPGTDFGRMIDEALKLFQKAKGKHRVLVVLSDGEDHAEDSLEAVKRAYSQGIIIHTIGIGTEEGVPIPLRNGSGEIEGYKKDSEGKIVTTRLSESFLQKMAITAGGIYVRGTTSGEEVREITKLVSGMEKEEFSSMIHSIYEERFQFPLAALILLLILEHLITTRKKETKAWVGRL